MAQYRGKDFSFSEVEMDEMLGSKDWDQKVIKVVQKGNQSWVGEVKIYNDDFGPHGKRATGADYWQWAAGDSISLSTCVPTGEKWWQ